MSITGRTTVGGMIAVMKQTTAEACSVNAEVTGGNAGGFAAEILEGSVISNSYAKRAVDLDSFQTAETAEACSVNAEVTGGNAGGFAAEILEGSVISNSYAKRAVDLDSFQTAEGPQGGFAAIVKQSQLSKNFGQLSWKKSVISNSYAKRAVDLDSFQTAEGPQGGFAAIVKQSQLSKNFGQLSWKKTEEKNETPAAAGVVGTFIGESGTGDQTPTKIEHNISFGPASYAFVGNQQGIAEGENYVGNYEYFWTGFLCICRKSAGDCRRRELCRKLRIS